MNATFHQFDDLPDEILMHIFKKLDIVQAIYSLMNVNQRIKRIVLDPSFANDLSFILYSRKNNFTSPSSDVILNQFCSKLLPQIGHQVRRLCLDRITMQRILRTVTYPNLNDLFLYDIDIETAKSLFVDENCLVNVYKNQLTSFRISFRGLINSTTMTSADIFIFTRILNNLTNLRSLKFNAHPESYGKLSFDTSLSTIISSTLLKLHVGVEDLTDCFYLLDGRFDQLREFYVNISRSCRSSFKMNHQKKNVLTHLRVFSFYCNVFQSDYEKLFLPLLRRMIHLEELHLTILYAYNVKLIDINTLKKDIVIHMPRLSKFTFNIYSTIHYSTQTNVPLNLYMQDTFEYFYGNQTVSYIDHFPEAKLSRYHIYSYPYTLSHYDKISNNFLGGIYTNVSHVSLYDERPFEYEFFLRIAQAFPFMEELRIENYKAQNDDQLLASIAYPNLTRLNISNTHADYVELFLFNTNISFSNNISIWVDYESLKTLTNNFTRNMTRDNCAKLTALHIFKIGSLDIRVKNYFPHTHIE